MEGMLWDFLKGKECVGAPQWSLGFAMVLNMWDVAGCLELDSLHRHPQPLHAISFGFITSLVLNRQAHVCFSIF
jgi:hypothetical protein